MNSKKRIEYLSAVLRKSFKTTDEQKAEIRSRLSAGESVSSVARNYGVSRATILTINSRGGFSLGSN